MGAAREATAIAGPDEWQPTPESRVREQPEAGATFNDSVAEVRRRYGIGAADFIDRLAILIRRRLGLGPLSPGAAIVAGLTGSGVRLLAAILAAALFG